MCSFHKASSFPSYIMLHQNFDKINKLQLSPIGGNSCTVHFFFFHFYCTWEQSRAKQGIVLKYFPVFSVAMALLVIIQARLTSDAFSRNPSTIYHYLIPCSQTVNQTNLLCDWLHVNNHVLLSLKRSFIGEGAFGRILKGNRIKRCSK